MNARVEELFHELADLSAEVRARYFTQHGVDAVTREEVEALLTFDLCASVYLRRDIGIAVARAFPHIEASGQRCGPFKLLEVIGRGGMGTVYLAESDDGERVAVKLLSLGAGDFQRDLFLRGRQILAALSHPNIARLLDA